MIRRSSVVVILPLIGLFAFAPLSMSRAEDQPSAADLLKQGQEQIQKGDLDGAKTTLRKIDAVQLTAAQREQFQAAMQKIRAGSAPAPAAAPSAPAAPSVSVQPTSASSDIIRQAMTLSIQQKLAEADAAAKAGQSFNASQLYEQVLSMDPSNAEAKKGLENARSAMGREPGGAGLLGNYGDVVSIRRQQAVARYDAAMEQAAKAAAAGNYGASRDAASLAKAILDTNRQYLSEADYNERAKAAGDLAAKIDTDYEKQRVTTLTEQEKQARTENKMRSDIAEQERTAKVQQLLRRAADLRKDLNYDQALEVLEQLLFIDPNNVAAQAMKEMIEDSVVYRNQRDLERMRGLRLAQHSVANLEAAVPYTELIRYPADWPQLTQNRLQLAGEGSGESEANRRISEKLKQAIPIQFENNRFENVVEYLRNVTGVNIFVNWRAIEDAGIERGAPISLNLANVPADKALKLILDQVGGDQVKIGFAIDDGVVTISTVENLGKNTTIRSYDIRDLLVVPPVFADAPVFDLTQVGQSGKSGGGGGGLFNDAGAGAGATGPSRQELIEQISTLIRETVDPENWRNNGGLVSSMNELNGQLIISTTSQNHRSILALLNQLRETRALQINVEARFLFVTTNFLEEVGVDLDLTLDSLNWGNFFKATQPIAMRQSHTNNPAATDVSGTPQNEASRGIADRGSPGLPGVSGTGFSNPPSAGDFDRGITTSITGTFLNDIQVNLFIRATQANKRNTTLSAPRLTFFNGQRSYVLVATQTAYVSDLSPVVGTNAVGFDPEISVVSTGVVLDVEGTVSADRRYVTMTVRPSLAKFTGPFRLIQVQAAGGLNGIATAFIEAPEIELTTVRTTVSVPDKGTLMMGGQRLYGDLEVEAGVPVLGKLPIINRFFSSNSTVKDERTLLILVKPTILIQSEKENELFPGLQQSPQLFNTGTSGPAKGGAGAPPAAGKEEAPKAGQQN